MKPYGLVFIELAVSDSALRQCVGSAGLTGLDEAGIRFCLDRYNNETDELRCIGGEVF